MTRFRAPLLAALARILAALPARAEIAASGVLV
jgi:hypothetical protein